MSKSIKVTRKQVDFMKMITQTETLEAAVDKLVELMVEEDCPRSELVRLVDRCIEEYPKYFPKK